MREQDTIHERTIFLLSRDFPTAQTKGFRRAIQRLQWEWEWDDWHSAEENLTWNDFLREGEPWRGGMIPDLWLIDEEAMSVVCIEVEDTNRINTAKLNEYIRLWWHLDNMYWETHLLCSDRWGNLTPVPLSNYTAMGLANTETHRAGAVIEAELDAKKTVFELTTIYAIRDNEKRAKARKRWLKVNPTFGLMTNPRFNRESFLKLRGIIASTMVQQA